MNKIMKAAWILAASALTMASCAKEEILAPEEDQANKITVNITAGSIDTKTHYDGSAKIKWDQTGEAIELLEQAHKVGPDGQPALAFAHVSSKSTEVAQDGSTAKFTASLTEVTDASSFDYYAVYPSTGYATSSNSNLAEIKLIHKNEQNPTDTSFDPAADLLVSSGVLEQTTQPTTLDFQFARPLAIMEMTVKGITEGEKISSVVFHSESAILSGRMKYNFETGKVFEYGYQGQELHDVTCNYTDYTAVNAGTKIYFTVFPATLADFTVTVNTDKATYTKTVDLSTNPKTFNANDLVKFSVNKLTREEKNLVEFNLLTAANIAQLKPGYKVIITNGKDGNIQAMGGKIAKNRMGKVAITAANNKITSVSPDVNVITLEGTKDNFLLYGLEGYISLNGTENELIYKTEVEASKWTISIPEGQTNVDIISGTRPIRFNTSYFASYKGTTSCEPIYVFYKEGTPRTPLATPTGLTATVAENTNVAVVNWTAVENAVSYTVTCGENSKIVDDPTTNAVIELAWATTNIIEVVANPDPTNVKLKSSAPATKEVILRENPNAQVLLADGDYVVMYNAGTDGYMGLTSNASKFNLNAGKVDYDGTVTSVSTTEEFIWHIVYDETKDAYSLYNEKAKKFMVAQADGTHMNAKLSTTAGYHKLSKIKDNIFTIGETQKLWYKSKYTEFTFDGTPANGTDKLLIIPVDTTPEFSIANAEISSAAGTPVEITTVTTNMFIKEGSFSATSNADWLTVPNIQGGKLIANVKENTTTAARVAKVTVTYTGAKEPTQTITVTQAAKGVVVGQTETIIFKDVATANSWTAKNTPAKFTQNDVTVSFSSSCPWHDPEIRVYQNSSMTVNVPQGKNITKVEFTTDSKKNGANVDPALTGSGTSWTWSGSANSIKFGNTAQYRVSKIVVTYK